MGIIGTLFGFIKWLYGELQRERNHFEELANNNQKKIDKIQDENLKLRRKVDERDLKIEELKKEVSDLKSGTSFSNGKDSK